MDDVLLAIDEPVGSSRRGFIKQAAAAAVVTTALVTSPEVFAASHEADSAAISPSSLPNSTLLDSAGRMHNPPSVQTVTGWRRELRSSLVIDADRKARLHLLIGEYDLAIREQPEDALRHFHAAHDLVTVTDPIRGWSVYNIAVGYHLNGEYRKSADAFHDLLHHDKPALRGFNRSAAAYWLRHAGACAAGHEQLAALGIPRPQKLDVRCGVAGLSISLKALGMPSTKSLMMSVTHVTGRGSNAQDLVDACDRLRTKGKADVRAHVFTADDHALKSLPLPVIAHVEHDHFVTVVKADEQGVSYICTDCGPFPGGKIDLT